MDQPFPKEWLAISVPAIFLIVRALKDDTRFPTVPVRLRPWLSIALGLLAGVIEKVLAGSTWGDAALFAATSGGLPILAHVLGVESLAGDRDVPLPSWFKAPAETPRPPDDDDDGPPVVKATTAAVVLALLFAIACASRTQTPPPGCASDEDRERESDRYIIRVLAACDRTEPLSRCESFPRLKAEHDDFRKRWVECLKQQ